MQCRCLCLDGDVLPHPCHPWGAPRTRRGLGDWHCGLAEEKGRWQTCLNGSWLFKVK